MAHTGLAFYRRSQTLENLSKERPKSIEALHNLLTKAVDEVESKVKRLERNFYCGMKCEAYLNYLGPIFYSVMDSFQVTFLHASWQIRDVMRRYEKFGDQYGVDRMQLSKFKEFGDKLNESFPEIFNEVMSDIQQIVDFLKKYCRSFFKGKRDPLVDIATRYDQEKKDFIQSADEQLLHIKQMGLDFKDKGVTQKTLSTPTNQMGRKVGCSYLPLLLCFPEACANIRTASESILKWIKTDRHYPEIVKNDIELLESKKITQTQEVREARENNVLTEHKHKSLQKEVAEMSQKVEKLKPQQEAMEKEIHKLTNKTKNIKLDMNLREEDLEDLRMRTRSSGSSVSSSNNELLERFEHAQGEVRKLRLKTYMINRQIDALKSKHKVILDKQTELELLKKEAIRYGKMSMVSKTEVVLAVRDMEKIERCLGQLKDIHRKRTSPNITRKIFNNQPIEPRSKSGRILSSRSREGEKAKDKPQPKPEALERVCSLVAKHIGSDWPKLYRNLAFFPRRGEATLDSDIDHIINTHYRNDSEVHACAAFTRWRRMHSRASVDDIKRALETLKRKDILDKVNEMLKPKDVKEKAVIRRHLHVKQAIARFMMLKRMGMTLPSAQAERARHNALLEQSAMASHIAMAQQQNQSQATQA